MTLGRRTAGWRRSARVLLGTLAATVLAVWPWLPAEAHTQAIASWPAAGQVVNTAPDRVSVAYSTDVLPEVRVEVVDADGTLLADGEPVVVGRIVTVALVPSAGPGVVSATFHVIGDDLHAVDGTLEFAVDPAGVETGNPAGLPPELGLDDVDTAAQDDVAAEAEPDESGSGLMLVLAGLVGAVVLVVVIRLIGRRRRA